MALDDTPSGPRQEDDDSESSTELLAPDTSSEKEVARLAHGRIADLERRLSETLTERDRHIAQLTDQLTQKNALLEQALANAAEAKKHAGLELRGLQAKLDELMLSRGEHLRTLEQAKSDLQKATSYAANADERGQPACEHETELAEMRAELEDKKSELEAVRLRLTDAENCCAKSKAEADTLRAQSAAGLVNTDVDQVIHRLMERMRAMEAEMSSRQWNEKSIESMECRNEG
jgi:chromosome segregation ATPase